MKRILLLLLMLLPILPLNAQVFNNQIVDENDIPLKNVMISDTISGDHVFTDSLGNFSIFYSKNSVFVIRSEGYITRYIRPFTYNDSLISLFADTRLLNTVAVTSDKTEAIHDKENQTVIDYVNLKDFDLVLFKNKSSYYLSFNQNGRILQKYPIEKLKPYRLFIDCFDNIHLLTKTSAYQLAFAPEIQFIQTIPIENFNTTIAPCIAVIDTSIIKEAYTSHNKKYCLAHKTKSEKAYTPFFIVFDSLASFAAQEMRNEIIGLYYVYDDTISNVITNGIWDGDLLSLGVNHELITRIGHYERVLAKEISIYAYRQDEQILLFDLTFDSLHIFDKNTKKIYETALFPGSKTEKIILDKASKEFYALQRKNGIAILSRIDLSTGKFENILTLDEISYAENFKVFNNWLYFLENRNGFRKLYRIRL